MSKKFAVVFPGQGSQSLGMLGDIAAHYPEIEATYSEASQVLGYDLWQLTQQGPESQLNQTEFTQPALLVAGVALWRLCNKALGNKPAFFAGHSLGEYTALVCAGAISLSQAVALVSQRGRLMQEAVPQGAGAMAAILGLEDDVIVSICAEASTATECVDAANFNAPGQVVIAGHTAAVTRAQEAAKIAGARKVVPLTVSVPSHCRLMKPAAEKLAVAIQAIDWQVPHVPVITNVDAVAISDPAKLSQALVRQLTHSVRWVETIREMDKHGVTTVYECGPGKVLAGLNKRISDNIETVSLGSYSAIQSILETSNKESV